MKEEVIKFWEDLYKEGKMPWDFGGVPFQVEAFADKMETPKSILIPGCGSAYEARFLAERGFDVTAIDISAEAIKRAAQILGDTENVVLEVADFFELSHTDFDFIYERAFLCSFNPDLRSAYVDKASRLLNKNGSIFGFYFVDRHRESGPPFPIEDRLLKELMSDQFNLIEDEQHVDGLEVFDGNERWQVWLKK